jgi:lipopolysaccharide export system permease protein
MIGWTLGAYFFRRYIQITAWMFLGTFALIFLIDFTEFSNRTGGLPGFSFSLALGISAMRVPMIMQYSVAFIGLFSAMATLVSLNRKYELVVARAAGVSAWQFLSPVCLGAFLFGLSAILVLNPIAAHGLARAAALEVELRAGSVTANADNGTPWLRQSSREGDSIIGARSVLDQGMTMVDAVIIRLREEGGIAERIDAERATLRDGYWELSGVVRRQPGQPPEKLAHAEIATDLRPEFVQERLAQPETIPFFALARKIEVARSLGLQANRFAMHFHSLASLPALLVAMTLIAATVSLRFVRMGQPTALILGGILAGFLLYVVTALVTAFGSAGLVPPLLAAWLPVIVAMFYGVTFLLYREDG